MNYGEADRIVTLFGRETGRALGAGARRAQEPARFAGGLGLCAVGEASVRERAGRRAATLERFDVTESHHAFGSGHRAMAHAAYAAELVGKLCAPRQVEPAVYDWLVAFLSQLDREGASAERLRVLELGLLGRARVRALSIDTCAVCGGDATPAGADIVAFRWDPDRGGAVCVALRARGRPMPAGGARGADAAGRDAAGRRRATSAAGRRQPRLPRGAARDHHPPRRRVR